MYVCYRGTSNPTILGGLAGQYCHICVYVCMYVCMLQGNKQLTIPGGLAGQHRHMQFPELFRYRPHPFLIFSVTCMYVCICVCVRAYVLYVCVYVYIICVYVCVCKCIAFRCSVIAHTPSLFLASYVCMYACIRTCMNVHVLYVCMLV